MASPSTSPPQDPDSQDRARARRTDGASPSSRGAALRVLGLFLLVALPIATLIFLLSAGYFDIWHGKAVCHRPLAGSDGQGDEVRRFIIDQEIGPDLEEPLPVAAFEDSEIPSCPRGVPPSSVPEGAPEVHKDLFSLYFSVDGTSWPTPDPADLAFPLLALLVALPLRNWFATGSPFRLTGRVQPPPVLQARPGTPAPRKRRGRQGPPPSHLRRRGRRRR